MPISRAKARAKLRSLMWARRRAPGTERSASRWSAIHAWSSRSGRRSAVCAVELGAELGLAAGALHEEHEPAGGLERDLAAEVLLDERQRQVHPGGHAGRGVDVAVAHEDRVGVRPRCRGGARRAARSWPSAWWRGGRRAGPPRRAGTRRCRPRPRAASAAAAAQRSATGSARRARARARRGRRPRPACRSGRGSGRAARRASRVDAEARSGSGPGATTSTS